MNGTQRASVADLYQKDLDRHLFAWTPRRRQRRKPGPILPTMSQWLGAWLVVIWTHWKAALAGGL